MRPAAGAALAALLALALLVAGCGGSSGTQAPGTTGSVEEPAESVPDRLAELEAQFYEADLQLGAEVFDDTCSVCHGRDGGGGVGAALGGVSERLSVRSHLAVVVDGRGTMPPFGGLLTDAEVAAVVAYQRSTFGDQGDQ